jgi:hypothetical protein
LETECAVCKGTSAKCVFCNGTGEYTKIAETYMKSHICQCIMLDRKNCPLCQKKCHHNTPNRPKLLAGGGIMP